MEKNYEKWTPVKIIVNNNVKVPTYKEGRIYWMAIGENVGFEQDGKGKNFTRPVLVIKGFSKNLFWGIPLTTKNKNGKFYKKCYAINNVECNIILSQLRAFDASRIWGKHIGTVNKEELLEIKNRLKSLL